MGGIFMSISFLVISLHFVVESCFFESHFGKKCGIHSCASFSCKSQLSEIERVLFLKVFCKRWAVIGQ